jgi:hypothetical protein
MLRMCIQRYLKRISLKKKSGKENFYITEFCIELDFRADFIPVRKSYFLVGFGFGCCFSFYQAAIWFHENLCQI